MWNFWRISDGVERNRRIDEFFVVLGNKLVKRILDREYCREDDKSKCNPDKQLIDTNYGGTSLAI